MNSMDYRKMKFNDLHKNIIIISAAHNSIL